MKPGYQPEPGRNHGQGNNIVDGVSLLSAGQASGFVSLGLLLCLVGLLWLFGHVWYQQQASLKLDAVALDRAEPTEVLLLQFAVHVPEPHDDNGNEPSHWMPLPDPPIEPSR